MANNIEELYDELDNYENVEYRMREEGFDYCFEHYSHWEEITDDKFHELRKQYLSVKKEFEKYVSDKIDELTDKIGDDENE